MSKHKKNYNVHDFLLREYFGEEGAGFLEIGGFVLRAYFAKDVRRFLVAVYTKESWDKSEKFLNGETVTENKERQNRFKYLMDKE